MKPEGRKPTYATTASAVQQKNTHIYVGRGVLWRSLGPLLASFPRVQGVVGRKRQDAVAPRSIVEARGLDWAKCVSAEYPEYVGGSRSTTIDKQTLLPLMRCSRRTGETNFTSSVDSVRYYWGDRTSHCRKQRNEQRNEQRKLHYDNIIALFSYLLYFVLSNSTVVFAEHWMAWLARSPPIEPTLISRHTACGRKLQRELSEPCRAGLVRSNLC